MTEIKKFTKIVILYYGIAGLLFAFLYLVLTDMQLMIWAYNDPVTFWSLGGTMLVLAIASFLAFFKKEWEQIKLYFEIMLMWIIGALLMNVAIVTLITLPESWIFSQILDFVVLSFNLIVGLIAYVKQRG